MARKANPKALRTPGGPDSRVHLSLRDIEALTDTHQTQTDTNLAGSDTNLAKSDTNLAGSDCERCIGAGTA